MPKRERGQTLWRQAGIERGLRVAKNGRRRQKDASFFSARKIFIEKGMSNKFVRMAGALLKKVVSAVLLLLSTLGVVYLGLILRKYIALGIDDLDDLILPAFFAVFCFCLYKGIRLLKTNFVAAWGYLAVILLMWWLCDFSCAVSYCPPS